MSASFIPPLTPAERRARYGSWDRQKGLYVCPHCRCTTSKPEAHLGSAVCLAGMTRLRLREKGLEVVAGSYEILLLAGVWLTRDVVEATNAVGMIPEEFHIGWYAPSDVARLARDIWSAHYVSGLPSVDGQLLCAAIIERSLADAVFLEATMASLRLGASLGSLRSEVVDGLSRARSRLAGMTAATNRVRLQEDRRSADYYLARLRSGLPVTNYDDGLGMQRRSIQRIFLADALKDPVLAVALRKQASASRWLRKALKPMHHDVEDEDA